MRDKKVSIEELFGTSKVKFKEIKFSKAEIDRIRKEQKKIIDSLRPKPRFPGDIYFGG